MTSDVTCQDIIEDLQRVADIVDRAPSKSEYKQHGKYSTWHLYELFDGLNDAREQAGLSNSDTCRAKPVGREELIDAIHDLYNDLGRVPKREEMKSHGPYSEAPYRRVFGTWSEAVQEAGYEPHRPGKYVAEYAEKECAYCGDRFSRLESSFNGDSDNYFCSTDCQNQHLLEFGGGEEHPLYNRVTVECSWCGDALERKPSEVEMRDDFFCNMGDCYSEWCSYERTRDDHPRFKGGREKDRGPNWQAQRQKALERDGYVCQMCGRTQLESNEEFGRDLDIHHKTPVREFRESDSKVDWKEVNRLDNLVTLCLPCHRHAESPSTAVDFN